MGTVEKIQSACKASAFCSLEVVAINRSMQSFLIHDASI